MLCQFVILIYSNCFTNVILVQFIGNNSVFLQVGVIIFSSGSPLLEEGGLLFLS